MKTKHYYVPWPRSRIAIGAARKAFIRCKGVPYLSELNRREHLGMLLMEDRGEIIRDEGVSGLHWHVKPK